MNSYMIYGIVILVSVVWIAYELWSAPLAEETEEGFKIIKPGKKLSDLFKKRN